MNQLYRIKIRLLSSIVTPLKGDTIWGHVAWGIVYHEGEDCLKEFLEQEKNEEPVFVVSSAFPSDCIPKPIEEPVISTGTPTKTMYAEFKKRKKQKYIHRSEIAGSLLPIGNGFEEAYETHNSINRISSSVLKEGGLYSIKVNWPKSNLYDLYVSSSFGEDRILMLLRWAFENGFGADASVGKGRIEVTDEITVVPIPQPSSRYMSLGPFVCGMDSGITGLFSNTFVRRGMLGGGLNNLSPYKKPVVLFDEGATFNSDKPMNTIGVLLSDIHSDSRICQSAFAPVIPVPGRKQ